MDWSAFLNSGFAVAIALGMCALVLALIGWVVRTRAKLGRARAALHMAGRIGGVGHWRINVSDGFVWWSEEVFRIHRRPYDAGPPSLDEALEYYAPEDREQVSDAVARAMEQGSSFRFMADLVREDGERITVVSRGICEAGPTGSVSTVYGVFVEHLPIRSSDFAEMEGAGPAKRRRRFRRKRKGPGSRVTS